MDAAAEWNGLGRVFDTYACSPDTAPDEDAAYGLEDECLPVAAVTEFARNVGLSEQQLGQMLRKLGADQWASLAMEDLRGHDLIVALDSEAFDGTASEMQIQGLQPDERLILFSDVIWLFNAERSAVLASRCTDGSGVDFLEERAADAVARCEFEQRAARAEGEHGTWGASDVPTWPAQPLGLGASDATLGDWRALHYALLQGSWGLAWYLVQCWKGGYANPLSKVLDHADATPPPRDDQPEETDGAR